MPTVSYRIRLLLIVTALGCSVSARADVTQTLDSVDAVAGRSALDMRFSDPLRTTAQPYDYKLPYAAAEATGFGFVACQRSANRDLYCLLNSYVGTDGKLTQPVRRWTESGSTEDLFSCTDPALVLDGKRSNPCTSLTVDLAGNVWLGGRDGSAYSVIKVVEIAASATCTAGPLPDDGSFKGLTADLSSTSNFCFRRYASGRPIIVDMTTVDDKVGAGFQVVSGTSLAASGPGILVLEDRKTAVFVADRKDSNGTMSSPLPPYEIASGKTGWGLVGNELVQSATLLQLDCSSTNSNIACTSGTDKKVNFVLVTTSTGKVVAKRTDPLATATVAFPALATCDAGVAPQFWVRVSPQSGSVYLSDRSCNAIRQLTVSTPLPPTPAPGLAQATALSTAPATTSTTDASNALNTLSVSPGIGFDLNDCYSDDCVFVPDTNGNTVPGAKINSVVIDQQTGQSGLTVFRITGIPDCRNLSPSASDYPANCNGAIVTVNGVGGFLDVAKLLPLEVLSLFSDSTTPTRTGLTLLVSPQYRARPPCTSVSPRTPAGCMTSGGNTFGAFFGRTEDDTAGSKVVFRNTFFLKFDIGQLDAENLVRCGMQNAPPNPLPRSAADWDVIATVSERNKTANYIANGPLSNFSAILSNADMLVNTFCENPTSGSGDRWSLYAYGLMLADSSQAGTTPVPASFTTLIDRLYDELEQARTLTACRNFAEDGNSDQPLSPTVCSGLAADWANGRDKLTKCIQATYDPKSSTGDQNCQAFASQFDGYRTRLGTASINWYAVPPGQVLDKANRLGELKARTDVIRYIFNCQFLPAVGGSSTQCALPPPW